MRVKMAVAQEYFNKTHLLRRPDPNRVLKYAEAMKRGEEFPVIHLGEYHTDEGAQKIVVDGVHRLQAARLLKWKHVNVVFERYDSEAHALADQLNRNMRHGWDLADSERDTRIKLLANKYGWTLRQIGKEIGLHFTGVGRIIRGLSHGSKPGPRPGVGRKPLPVDPQRFINLIKTADFALADSATKHQLLAAIVSSGRTEEETNAVIERMCVTGKSLVELAKDAKRAYAHA